MQSETKYLIGFIVATVAILLGGVFLVSKNPSPPPLVAPEQLVSAQSHVLGAKDAKVTIVEFSDFQCPACAAAYPVVKQVLEKYKDKIMFVYRHYPLSIHPFAQKAAEAAEAAAAQGKFWQMHDKMFENQESLKIEDLKKYAKDLKLNTEKFNEDLDSGKYADIVQKDLTAGNKVGIDATPTFFINGEKFVGVLSLEDFQKQIEKDL